MKSMLERRNQKLGKLAWDAQTKLEKLAEAVKVALRKPYCLEALENVLDEMTDENGEI